VDFNKARDYGVLGCSGISWTICHFFMTDLVVAFVLFFFMLVLLCFLCCYRFSVNEDLYIVLVLGLGLVVAAV